MKENRFLVREDIGTDHESVSYYMIQEVKNCDSPKELSLATPQGSL